MHDQLGQLEDTLIVYVSGDNGASPEGNATGQWNWGNFLNGIAESPEEQAKYLDKWGGPETYPMMSVGWAIAFNSPSSQSRLRVILAAREMVQSFTGQTVLKQEEK